MAKVNIDAVRKELEKATGVTRNSGEGEKEYLMRIMRKVAALDDKEWKALSEESQDWYNDAAEAVNAKKELPTLGDSEPEKEPETRSRRRATDDDGDEKPKGRSRAAAEEDDAPADPKVGDTVTIKTEDGETFKGEVLEISERSIVIDDDGEEEVIKRKNVKSIKVSGAKAEAAKDEPPAEPKVGDTVDVTMDDGEVYTGELIEAGERSIVVDVKGEEEVLKRKSVKSIKVAASKAKADDKPKEDEKPAGRSRRGAAKDDDGDKAPRTRARRGDGEESDVSKAWKLIAENLDDDFAAVTKKVAKAGLDVKENTLNIKYNDVHKHYDLFKELGYIKR